MWRCLCAPPCEPPSLARTFSASELSLAKGIGDPERKYSRIGPGMFEPFDQLPHGPMEGSRHTGLLSPFHKLARVAVKLDSQSPGHRFAFRDEGIKKRAGRRQPCGGAMVEERQRAHGICRRIEDQLRPLGATCVFERDNVHAAAIEQVRKSLDKLIGRARRLERPDPRVAVDVKADVPRSDKMTCRKRRSPNHVSDMLGKNLFVANAVLHRAHRAARTEDVFRLLDGRAGVRAFRGNNAKIANRNRGGVRRRVQAHRKIRRAADAQAALIDGANVVFVDVVSVDFDFFQSRKMRPKDTANRAAADDRDLHAHAGSDAASPASSAASKSGRERKGQWPPGISIGSMPSNLRLAPRDHRGFKVRSSVQTMDWLRTAGHFSSGRASVATRLEACGRRCVMASSAMVRSQSWKR